MEIKYLILIYYFTFSICILSSANDNAPCGARSSGIGNASVSLSDLWAVQNNQAGLGFVKTVRAGIYYHNQFMLKELAIKSCAFSLPTKSGTFGLYVSHFGYSIFSQAKYGIAFGKSFGDKISAGIMMNYLVTCIAEYGKKGVPVAEAGLMARPINNLTIGIHIYNLSRTQIIANNGERIPTVLRLGADYKLSDKILIVLEAEKDINRKTIVKSGLEYLPVKELYLRAGIATNPLLSCFGIGVYLKQFRLDVSSTYHSVLGLSPQLGLSYEFAAIEKKKIN